MIPTVIELEAKYIAMTVLTQLFLLFVSLVPNSYIESLNAIQY